MNSKIKYIYMEQRIKFKLTIYIFIFSINLSKICSSCICKNSKILEFIIPTSNYSIINNIQENFISPLIIDNKKTNKIANCKAIPNFLNCSINVEKNAIFNSQVISWNKNDIPLSVKLNIEKIEAITCGKTTINLKTKPQIINCSDSNNYLSFI